MNKTQRKNAVVAAAEAAVKAKKAGRKNFTKGALARGLILAGVPVADIAKRAKTTEASVYWYRSELRRMGASLPQ